MNYIQLLFSFFNAPLFATFIIAHVLAPLDPVGRVLGTRRRHAGAFVTHMLYAGFSPLGIGQVWHFNSDLAASFWGAIVAFVADAVVTVGVSLVTKPKPEEELRGLVWGLDRKDSRRTGAASSVARAAGGARPRSSAAWPSPAP